MKQYMRKAIAILDQLGYTLDEQQLQHLKSLHNETQVNNFKRDIYNPMPSRPEARASIWCGNI